jgi:peptidoglycan/LPS O-acetylase OafA/YrhL
MQTIASPAKAARISGLDFVKGALVLFMVLYHWINYFVGPQWGYYRYLRFLSPSFIFIAGFMVSHVYLAKYEPANPRLPRRLFTRGLKLLAIFFVLNLLRYGLLPVLSGGSQKAGDFFSAQNMMGMFVNGDLNNKLIAFYILIPIAYLLMLSGLLVIGFRSFRQIFLVAYLFLLAGIIIYDAFQKENQNLEIVAIGMLGVLAGFAPMAKINNLVRHRYALMLGYCSYLIAIAIWNVPYPLETAGTLLSVVLIYRIGAFDWTSGVLRDEVILLGKYSLFGYISQIAILQVLEAGLRHLNQEGAKLIISFVAGLALTVLCVELMDRARKRGRRIDGMYKAVFN